MTLFQQGGLLHSNADIASVISRGLVDAAFSYSFENFYHPFVGDLIARLNRSSSVADLLTPDSQKLDQKYFDTAYDASTMVSQPHPEDTIDVAGVGPYSNYNWELFFHVPFTIAVHLSKNQRFAEAERWFHYIFDPTNTDESVPPPERFWKFLRFRNNTSPTSIDDILTVLSKPESQCSSAEKSQRSSALTGYEAILSTPFQPHAVARTRILAYQYAVLMKYLDNHIACGDFYFAQNSLDTLPEAIQHYVTAANLLGQRPEEVPVQGAVAAKSFNELKNAGIGPIGNALVDLEAQFPFNFGQPQTGGGSLSGPLFGIGRSLYFCVPANAKLLGYWDTVADRLYKIRHCMDITGAVRQLPLFDPPLDPGMLVKAAAAGVNVDSIVSGLSQPIGPVRALPLIQKALEVASEVRGLGQSLLAAIEKGDGEHLARLRQGHEIQLQQLTQDVRFLQWKQAQESTRTLLRTRASAWERYQYYLRLLGQAPDTDAAPENLATTTVELSEDNFDDAYDSLVGQYDRAISLVGYPPLKLAGDASPSNQSGATGSGALYLNASEDAELNTHLPAARDIRLASSVISAIAGVFAYIPDLNANLHFWGLGASAHVAGGQKLSTGTKIAAEILQMAAVFEQDQAGLAFRAAGHQRRADEWLFQARLAARELMQIGRQVISSAIAEQVARHEYLNIQAQVEQSQEVEAFLESKFTCEELYGWMQGELSRIYYDYYRFAIDLARRAERTMKWELMRPELDDTTFIQFNYWDTGRKGLLSGEALHFDLKRMEVSYHDNNKPEPELTKAVSLRQLDPIALLNLKTSGACDFSIPEWFFDRDFPGYMRRIKYVSLSPQGVVGPYTGINCALSLVRSTVRVSPSTANGYDRTGLDDDRFIDYPAVVQPLVTSTGTNDAGRFEVNLRDDKLLLHEGAGAISTWHLELPRDLRQFDYSTISDVILHVRYTVRSGGADFAAQAVAAAENIIASAQDSGLALMLSLKHDFPTEWAAFTGGAGDLTVALEREQFPYMVQYAMQARKKSLAVPSIELFTASGPVLKSQSVPVGTVESDLNQKGITTLTLQPDQSADDAFLVVHFGT